MNKFKTFLASLLGIVTIICLVLFTSCYLLKRHLSKEVILDAIKDNDLSVFIDSAFQDNQEILDQAQKVLVEVGLPQNLLEQVMNSEATKNFLGIYVSNTVDALFGKEEEVPLRKDDLKALIKDNLAIAQQDLPKEEREFLEAYENKAYEYIDQYGDKLISYFPTPSDIIQKIDENKIVVYNNITLKDILDFISLITSTSFLLTFLGIIMVLLLLIYLLKRKIRWSKYFAFVFGMYAFLMIIVEIVILTIMKSAFMSKLSGIEAIINYLINGISKTLWLFILPAILLTIISYIFYKKKKGLLTNAQVSDQLSN